MSAGLLLFAEAGASKLADRVMSAVCTLAAEHAVTLCCAWCRVSRMLRQPIAGLLSNMLLNYSSKAHVAIHAYPQLVGLPFQDLHAYFPCGYEWPVPVSGLGPAVPSPLCMKRLLSGHICCPLETCTPSCGL